MSRPSARPLVSIALPVRNGGETVAQAVATVLAQSYSEIELVISDNASTDDTEEICRRLAREDGRVVYQRHPTNVGLLNNFVSAAEKASGPYLRWLGDDDALARGYVEENVAAFAEDERRVLVTTQVAYRGPTGAETLNTDYDPVALSSADPVERFSEMLRLLTSGFALLDPIYSMMRRELAVLPRRNMLREDEVYAARLALAGPWGHVSAPLARRPRSQVPTDDLVRLLGLPAWHGHAMDLLQCRELLRWIARSPLDPDQRRAARVEVLRMYARRKRNKALRGVAKLERLASRPDQQPSRS